MPMGCFYLPVVPAGRRFGGSLCRRRRVPKAQSLSRSARVNLPLTGRVWDVVTSPSLAIALPRFSSGGRCEAGTPSALLARVSTPQYEYIPEATLPVDISNRCCSFHSHCAPTFTVPSFGARPFLNMWLAVVLKWALVNKTKAPRVGKTYQGAKAAWPGAAVVASAGREARMGRGQVIGGHRRAAGSDFPLSRGPQQGSLRWAAPRLRERVAEASERKIVQAKRAEYSAGRSETHSRFPQKVRHGPHKPCVPACLRREEGR